MATAAEVDHNLSSLSGGVNLSSVVNTALETKPRGFFADQFENESNYHAHYHGTGPEILRQTSGVIDAFVSGAGKRVLGSNIN